MKKRLLSLLLVATMATAMLAGCGQETKSTETGKTSTESGATSEIATTEEVKEVAYEDLPTINVLFSHGDDYEESENWQEVAKRVGAKIHFIGADSDKYNTMIASGEGYDILMATKADMKTLATGGSLLALDDLVAEKGEVITAGFSTFLEYSKQMYSDDTGALYWLPACGRPSGKSVGSKDAAHGLIRWDLYAEMGCPETNSVDEFLEMLVDMLAANPTTASGEKVYGMALPSDKLMFSFQHPFTSWSGATAYQKTGYYNWLDMSYGNYFDEDGIFWDGIEFYHKAYQLGLLDPDSFTLTEADMKAKAGAGRLLFVNANFQYDTMAEGQGFSSIPASWHCSDATEVSPSSVLSFSYGIGVNKNTENIDLCMNYLNFVLSEEGVNLILNGVEGKYYAVDANGVRSLTEEGIALYNDSKAWAAAGLGTASTSHFVGYSRNALGSDGKTMLLGLDSSLFQATLTDTQKDFCEHYGVEYPGQAFFQNAEKYNLAQMSSVDAMLKDFLVVPTDEIDQLEAAVLSEAEGLIASLVMADDAEYEAKVKAAKAQLAKVGVTKIVEYYESNWQSAYEKVKAFEN